MNHPQALACRQNMQVVNDHGAAMKEMNVVLKVDAHCPECLSKLDEVMRCTKGPYTSFTMDAEAQKVRITGRADVLLGILNQVRSRANGHAEVALVQINNCGGDSAYDTYYKYHHHYITNYGNPYNHDPRDDPYVYNGYNQAALPLEPDYYPQYEPRPCLCNIM